jgi:hypothetical protein
MNPLTPTQSPPPHEPSGVEAWLCELFTDMADLAAGKAMLAAHQMERAAADDVVTRMRADVAARQKYGHAKYPCDLIDNPATFRERIQHAYEESLDLAVYLTWALIYLGTSRLLCPLQTHVEGMQRRAMEMAIDHKILLDLFSDPNPTEPPPPQ